MCEVGTERRSTPLESTKIVWPPSNPTEGAYNAAQNYPLAR